MHTYWRRFVKLRDLRDTRTMTQKELATAAGVGLTTVARTERDEIRPRPATRRKLAAVLKVDPNEITWPRPAAGDGAASGD